MHRPMWRTMLRPWYVSAMAKSAQSEDDGQRRDALLRQLAKMPPLSRAEIAELARRAKAEKKANESREKRTRPKVIAAQ